MHPETLLAITTVFAGFLLKTSVGFCMCWALSRIVASPSGRFLVWLGFLAAAGCYWLYLAESLALRGTALAPLSLPMGLAQTASLGKWQIQPSWALPFAVAFRGLGVLYLVVLGYFMLAHIRKQVHLRWVLRFAYRAPEAIENSFQPLAESLNAGNVRLLMLSGIHSPATFGCIRPIVLLPPFCLERDRSDLEDIFRHELHHVRRRDFVFDTIASFARALLFFHPAVWYAMRRLELERELACDLAVISDSPERRATYAECLVRFARLNVAHSPTPWDLDFAGSSVQLKVRVRSVLAETRKASGWLLGLRATSGAILLAGFLGMVPSLCIVLSYAQQRMAQPEAPALTASHSRVRPRRQGVRKGRAFVTPASAAAASVLVQRPVQGPVEEEAVQIVPRESDAAFSREISGASQQQSGLGGAAEPESAPSVNVPIASRPSSYPGNPGLQRPSVASIITGAVSQIGRTSDHDHDKDSR